MSEELQNIYITTTLPYVNADPHIGFALELVQADALARFYRILGHKVFFSTGTDEHGQKIWEASEKGGVPVKDYVDSFASRFDSLKDTLGLSYDAFIRTTSPEHIKAAQVFWEKSFEKGDIYKKSYKGLYCVGHEAYMTERDLKDGVCPDHPNKELQVIEEENYFFKASKYEDEIREYLSTPGVIQPDFRRLEALKFIEEGMEDFSISRPKDKMSWGIPVPGDDEHVMYVWFEALVNYISTLGWPSEGGDFEKFWENGHTIQLAGKDQVRFQSIMWQAMLASVGISHTSTVFYHGFITSSGQKMSKSIGNVINPYDVVDEYGTDAFRYYVLRHIHSYDDSDFTDEKFKESYNAHLANGLGNLTSRVMKMAVDNNVLYGELPVKAEIWNSSFGLEYREHIKNFEYNKALDHIWGMINRADIFIATSEPFKVVKVDLEKGSSLISESVLELYRIAVLLEPIMPETALKIQSAVEKKEKPENLFLRK